ncbi:MAG: hypothetical protein ABIN36_01245 [Ferruginibacter sp.]
MKLTTILFAISSAALIMYLKKSKPHRKGNLKDALVDEIKKPLNQIAAEIPEPGTVQHKQYSE